MMAAGRAAECGAPVLLLEKTTRLGNKLRITGKGRCNLTNQTDVQDFIAHFGGNGRFLYGAFSRFFVDDLIDFFSRRGVETKVERGRRVFPISDDASCVAAALQGYIEQGDVQVRLGARVSSLVIEAGTAIGVRTGSEEIPAAAVILAAGGASYPRTGSSGDGYRIARAVGHTLVPTRPALVPLVTAESYPKELEGLSLRNVRMTLLGDDQVMEERFGEMLFTGFGLSGPIVLSASRTAVDALAAGKKVQVSIDLKPALSDEQLDARLIRDLDRQGRQAYHSILKGLLPSKLIPLFVRLTRVPGDKSAHQINSAERARLRGLLRDFRLTITASRPISEAIVTAGGVDTNEIDPRTMESKLISGLYFCGEIIDVDADTGGYNLQAAFSTGHLAGEAAAHAGTAKGPDSRADNA